MAHLGNTVVNGALRVLGGEYVDTINGVTVGNSPKFTDTTYTAATAAPGNIASAGSAGTSTNYARQDHTHKIVVATGDSDGQVKIAGQNASVKNCALKSDITTLQTNFQAGVDSVYNAVVAKGSTPASKSLSDVVAGISAIPNSNSGTYAITSNGVKDMGAANTYRYANVNVPNSNSTTYTFAANDTGGTKDLGATNNYRYVNASNVYTKGKADGKADHSATYKPTSRATANDMGQTHSYRYVNTTEVPNSNSGTQSITANGVTDMGATNTQRYVNVNVPNSNSGTYTFASGDTGGIKDMGATNSNRYVVATNVYNKGKADGKADHSTTYKPTARATANDMGQTHSYRYVDTTSVPNTNSGTQSITANGITDMGATNDKRYVNVSVANSNSGTYTPTTKGTFDMGATNNKRYVDTRSVANVNSGTYDATSNGVKDMTAANSYRYVNVNVPNSNSGTYSPTAKGTFDMGATNSNRYVDTRNVTNTHSGTSSTTYTSNGTKDLGDNHSFRYIKINVSNSNSGTYTPTTKGTFDMGATNNKRYVDTRSVANVNSGTYTPLGNKMTYDMGADNTYQYCDATNVYQAGWNAQSLSFIGSNRVQGKGNRSISMSTLSPGRYLVVTKSVPNIVNCGWSGACTYSLSTGTVENLLVHENKGGSGQYYWAYWIAIVKLTKTTPTNSVTVTHKYDTTITSTVSMSVFKLGS